MFSAPAHTNPQDHTSHLPVEILDQIFLWTHTLYEPDTCFEGMPNCTFLSHVCHRWREVALRCQPLWSEVVRPSLGATEFCLAHCRTYPIHINVDGKFTEDNLEGYRQAVRLAFRIARRADVVTIRLNTDEPTENLAEILRFGEHFFELRSLLIGVKPFPARKITIEYVSGPGDAFSLDDILQNSPSKLWSACFKGCKSTRPELFSSTTMRELRLKNSVLWNNVDEMITLFRAVPLLEVFEYSYDHDRHNAMIYPLEPDTSPPQLSLSYLRHLVLQSFWREDITIYSALRSSPRMNVTISSRTAHESMMETTSLNLVERVQTYVIRFGDCMSLLMQDSLVGQIDWFPRTIPVSIFFHDDHQGFDVQYRPTTRGTMAEGLKSQSFKISLPPDTRGMDGMKQWFSVLVRVFTSASYRPHLLEFNENLATVDVDLLAHIAPYTAVLILAQPQDVDALIRIFPDLHLSGRRPPAFVHLKSIEITADLGHPEPVFQKLAKALEDVYLTDLPSLWGHLTLYWHPRPDEVFKYNIEAGDLERVQFSPPGLGSACNPIF